MPLAPPQTAHVTAEQEELYEEIAPLVTSCLDGYNACIIAYGQTGSGAACMQVDYNNTTSLLMMPSHSSMTGTFVQTMLKPLFASMASALHAHGCRVCRAGRNKDRHRNKRHCAQCTGKTYTMQGTPASPGIYVRALQHLFAATAAEGGSQNCDGHPNISVAMLEIYNEDVRDLLAAHSPPGALPAGQAGRCLEVSGLGAGQLPAGESHAKYKCYMHQSDSTSTAERPSRGRARTTHCQLFAGVFLQLNSATQHHDCLLSTFLALPVLSELQPIIL